MERRTFARLSIACALLVSCAARGSERPLLGASDKTYELVNGQWFDGQGFQRAVFYSVDGALTKTRPARVYEKLDLGGGYVVPPFGDAHNHTISGPHDIDAILRRTLEVGVFYSKNPASIARDTRKIAELINKPDSVDVVFANAGLTASGGHPVVLYEKTLSNVKTPGPDGTFENLAYVVLDDQDDLERKWPAILADKPDFIKAHLLYSEEFDERRDDPRYEGLRGLDPKLLPKIVEKAHAANLRVSCHIETAVDFRNALAAGVDEINHLPGHYPELDHPEWFPITAEDAALAARQGVVVVTTIYVSMSVFQNAAELARAREIQADNLRKLRDAGVRIAIGPDVYGATALDEARSLNELHVFDELALLKMWCETTPETIFPERKIGRLSEGYEASFLVLGANPLERFENVEDIRMRFKQGRPLDVGAPAIKR